MKRLTVNKPVSEMTMVELAHNCCFVKDREAYYREYEGEMSARDMARELAKMCGYELPENNEEFDCEIMDDLYITENITKRSLIALFYRSLWAQAELYEHLKKYEETGITPEQIREIDKLYAEKCRELAEERKKHEWITCSERLPEERESIFAKFKGTDKWRNAMFEKMSDNVNVTVEFEDGTRMPMKGYTVDGKWKPDTAVKCKVIAWKPLPEPYNPERSDT